MQVSDPRQWGSTVIFCANGNRSRDTNKNTQNRRKASKNENIKKLKYQMQMSDPRQWGRTVGQH